MKLPTLSFSLVGYVFAAGLAIGAAGGWKLGAGHYQRLYEREVAAGWERKAKDETLARLHIQNQLATLQTNVAHNATVIHDLEQQNRAISADSGTIRDQLRRLRATQARSCSADRAVSEAGSGSPASRSSGDGEVDPFPQLAGDALDECRRNAAQLNALVEQITPQL